MSVQRTLVVELGILVWWAVTRNSSSVRRVWAFDDCDGTDTPEKWLFGVLDARFYYPHARWYTEDFLR